MTETPPILREIPPPSAVPLRLSEQTLPPYRYVLGLQPHPLRDPNGHGMNARGLSADATWRYGVDLFNARYYWEAHEAWESLWADARRDSATAEAIKGLIQVAASLLVLHLGREAATRKLAQRGERLLRASSVELGTLGGLSLVGVADETSRRLLKVPPAQTLDEAAFCLRVDSNSAPLWTHPAVNR